jgi:DNA-binding NarL/FixJ family response regulator
MATFVVAQPHELVLDALARLLLSSGLRVVGRCTSPAELERCVRSQAPDVVLVDAELAEPGALVELVRRTAPDARVVLLASAPDPALARETLAVDVDSVLLKTATSADFVAALRRIVAGDSVFPAGWLSAARRSEDLELSGRQREVLELLAQGLPNRTIAERLFISKNTVKFHIAGIYERLGVSNRVQAARALRDLA